MNGLNFWAILVAALSAFLLGGVWYSVLFRHSWQRAAGLTDEQANGGNKALIFGGTFVLSLISAFVFAMFLGAKPSLSLGLGAGFSAGLCWVAASFGINYLFERRSLGHFAVNGGYHTLQFTLYGLILALWH